MLCAPLRTAISSPCSWANRMVTATSAADAHRAIKAGRPSMAAFHSLRASSYSASLGAMTTPAMAERSASTPPFID
jgi:hypothetical protein